MKAGKASETPGSVKPPTRQLSRVPVKKSAGPEVPTMPKEGAFKSSASSKISNVPSKTLKIPSLKASPPLSQFSSSDWDNDDKIMTQFSCWNDDHFEDDSTPIDNVDITDQHGDFMMDQTDNSFNNQFKKDDETLEYAQYDEDNSDDMLIIHNSDYDDNFNLDLSVNYGDDAQHDGLNDIENDVTTLYSDNDENEQIDSEILIDSIDRLRFETTSIHAATSASYNDFSQLETRSSSLDLISGSRLDFKQIFEKPSWYNSQPIEYAFREDGLHLAPREMPSKVQQSTSSSMEHRVPKEKGFEMKPGNISMEKPTEAMPLHIASAFEPKVRPPGPTKFRSASKSIR